MGSDIEFDFIFHIFAYVLSTFGDYFKVYLEIFSTGILKNTWEYKFFYASHQNFFVFFILFPDL